MLDWLRNPVFKFQPFTKNSYLDILMYQVEQAKPSEDFVRAWKAAGQHIQNQADTGLGWIRDTLNSPMAEHLSFRIGNQIFFVFVEAAEFKYSAGKGLFEKVCVIANAIPCLMPMKKSLGMWQPEYTGWGLIHPISKAAINPLDQVSDELIEMTDWEIHDFAIQVVSTKLEESGKRVLSKQSSREIDPSIWFQDVLGSHYVLVRAGRYPESEVHFPDNIDAIKKGCSKMSDSGFFASVIFANSEDPFDPDARTNHNFLPLYRGHGVFPKYSGLQAL